MNAQLEKLIELQKIDQEIADFQSALDAIPGQIKSAEQELEDKKKELREAQEVTESLRKQRNQLEQDVQAEQDHMAKTKSKLPTVKTNKEYSAILAEIEGVKQKISEFEDRELEIMEQLEEKEKEFPAIEARSEKEQERERVQKELKVALEKRENLVSQLEPKWAQSYSRVFKLRNGQAVVPLQESVCQGCFQQVQPQVAIDIKVGEEVMQCPHCSRFLYWIEESESETVLPK